MADTFDLSQLQGLLGQFMPNEKDQAAAQKAALIQMGLGLLGARKGREWEQAGNAGQNAMATQQAYLQNAMTQRHQAMTAAGGAMDLLGKTQAFQDDQKSRALMQQLFGGGASSGPVQVPGGSPSGGLPPGAAGPPAEPMPMPIAPGPKGPTPFAAPGSTKQSKFEQYSALADMFLKGGLPAQAQKWSAEAEKYRPQLESQKTLTQPDGTRVQVNVFKDGTMQVVPGFGPDKEKAHYADTGNSIVPLDPFGNGPVGAAIPKTQTPDSVASNALTVRGQNMTNSLGYAHLSETQRHNQMVEGDPAVIEQTAQGIASGNLAPLSGFALGRPMGQQVMSRVMQLNPEYSAADFGTGQKSLKDFATGKQGNSVRSFNVALSHLDTLGTLADALHNKDSQAINKIGNFVGTQLGAPAVTNFVAAKKIVADEIVKAIVGSGGGVTDREEAAKTIAAANSPAQLKGVIDTYKTLMNGQLHGLRQQYETTTKRKDFNKFLSPEAQKYSNGTASDVRKQADAILGGG